MGKVLEDTERYNDGIMIKDIPLPFLSSSFKPGNARQWVESIGQEDVRDIAQSEYYYFTGKPEEAMKYAAKQLDNARISIKLSALLLYINSSLPLGNIRGAMEAMGKVKLLMEQMNGQDVDEHTQALGTFFVTTMHVLLHLPLDKKYRLMDYIPHLPDGLKLFACYVMAHKSYLEGDYSRALGIAETGIAMQEKQWPVPEIYLRIIMASCLMAMRCTEEAREQFMTAWELACQDELFEAFGEHHGLLYGLIENCLKKDEPEAYNRIIQITYSYSDGWRKVHNPIMKGSVADNLTTTEFSIAMLAKQRWTNVEIAQYMNLSEHTVKRYMSDVYQKLGITSRKQLYKYMLR